jgi:hypothetical protein
MKAHDAPVTDRDAALALYERLVATQPSVERKGATMPYTSCNGHMFSLLTKEGLLALRLPKDALAAFLARYKTKLAVQYDTVMKEYALVPDALLRKTSELAPHFATSLAFMSPTTGSDVIQAITRATR